MGVWFQSHLSISKTPGVWQTSPTAIQTALRLRAVPPFLCLGLAGAGSALCQIARVNICQCFHYKTLLPLQEYVTRLLNYPQGSRPADVVFSLPLGDGAAGPRLDGRWYSGAPSRSPRTLPGTTNTGNEGGPAPPRCSSSTSSHQVQGPGLWAGAAGLAPSPQLLRKNLRRLQRRVPSPTPQPVLRRENMQS